VADLLDVFFDHTLVLTGVYRYEATVQVAPATFDPQVTVAPVTALTPRIRPARTEGEDA
jgi:hypothetical protein